MASVSRYGEATDPATGVLRHLDAGYEEAEQAAVEHGLERT